MTDRPVTDRPVTDRPVTDRSVTDRHARGMRTRRAVLGDAHVDRAVAATTAFDAPFQTLITEAAWGRVWSDDTISRRERIRVSPIEKTCTVSKRDL